MHGRGFIGSVTSMLSAGRRSLNSRWRVYLGESDSSRLLAEAHATLGMREQTGQGVTASPGRGWGQQTTIVPPLRTEHRVHPPTHTFVVKCILLSTIRFDGLLHYHTVAISMFVMLSIAFVSI